MNATETSDKWIGATVTIVLHSILFIILLFIVVEGGSPDRPPGVGNSLEVSFGSDDEGSGNTESQPALSQAAAAQSESSPEDNMISNDASDPDVVVKKNDNVKKNPKVNSNNKKNNEKSDPKADNPWKSWGDQIRGDEGDGDDKKKGNKGNDGLTPGRETTGGGGKHTPVLITKHEERQANYDSQEQGFQVVKVKINRNGTVVSAVGNQIGTTNSSRALKSRGEELAKKYIYNEIKSGPEYREDTIKFNFYLK